MPTADDEADREVGFHQVEEVRKAIRAHFQQHGIPPKGVSLPSDKFKLFERWFPEWVIAWNEQNPPHMQIPCEKNDHGHILFGFTPIRSR